jgi:NADH-quinone oxidoreductase subunit M
MPFFFLIILVFFFLIFLFFIPNDRLSFIRASCLIFSIAVFLVTFLLLCCVLSGNGVFSWSIHILWNELLNIYYSGTIDGFSILFVVLTTFLIPFCVLYSWNQFSYFFKELMLLLFVIEFLLLNFFFVSDLFFSSFCSKVFCFQCLC